MKKQYKNNNIIWHDIIDPRRAEYEDDLEVGLKEPEFENLIIPERLGPVQEVIDNHKLKRYAFEIDEYSPWSFEKSPFANGKQIGQAGLLVNDLLQLFTLVYRASHVVGLHTEEQIWFENPVFMDEIITLDGNYTDAYVNRGQGCVVMDAIAKGEDGRTIVRHRGVEILKTIPGNITGRASATPEKKITGEVGNEASFFRTVAENIKIGDAIEPMKKMITAEQAAVFSRVGDFVSNIHNNLEIARKGNLRLPIVQGAQLFCCLTHMLTVFFGEKFLTGGWLKTKFISPVNVFEPIELSGCISGIETCPDGRKKILLDVWIRRKSDNRLAVIGWASCVM
ncbi:MAG: hypothetical protein E7476_11985 [Ruminococcaceae bacterium]|nr:hypothetical protein [Oscillospiraceae bacterium]